MPVFTAKDGCRVHYEVAGDGPALVLIPGLGGDGRFWDGVIAALPPLYRTISVDHRGAGRSDRPKGDYSIGQIAADVLGILDREGIGTAHFVGHSTGGAIVQTIAVDRPERGLSYTISGSWARSDERFRTIFKVRLDLLERGLTETYQHLTHVLGFSSDYLSKNIAELETAVANAASRLEPLPVTAARIRMLLHHDRLADLPRIAAPVLVVGAEDDVLLPLGYSRAIAAAIPGAQLCQMQGGHFFPAAHPSIFAGSLRTFLQEIGE